MRHVRSWVAGQANVKIRSMLRVYGRHLCYMFGTSYGGSFLLLLLLFKNWDGLVPQEM
jgi:hypothetical protein